MIEEVIEIAKKAGEEVLKLYKDEISFEVKKDDSPVTLADKNSEKVIIAGLEKFGYNIISEETVISDISGERLWIIDPLDGTKDFIEKTGEFCIMIGLIDKGEPILGVMYVPVENKVYYAQKGQGAYVKDNNGTRKLNIENDDLNPKFLASRHHTSSEEKEFMEKISKDINYAGSIGLKLGLIAEGKANAYINMSNKTHSWDTCAGEIILKEAGGVITDTKNNELKYGSVNTKNSDGVMAGSKVIHQVLIKNLEK